MSLAKVAIIIRYYNRTEFILEAIESALGQTYGAVDVVVVDDGSPQPLADFLPPAIQNRVQIVRTSHQGRSAALNNGIKSTSAEYLAFLDDDDMLDARMVEECMTQALRAQADVVLVGFKYFSKKLNDAKNSFVSPFGRLELSVLLDGYHLPVFNSMLIKRSLVHKAGLIDEGLDLGEDWDLWIRMAALNPTVSYVDVCLSYVRVHGANACHDDVRVKEWRLKVVLKSKSYIPQEVQKSIHLDFKISFRYLITGWYQALYGKAVEGRENICCAIKRSAVMIPPGLVLWGLSYLPTEALKYMTRFFEFCFQRKNAYEVG